jgi:hypothetical protein
MKSAVLPVVIISAGKIRFHVALSLPETEVLALILVSIIYTMNCREYYKYQPMILS